MKIYLKILLHYIRDISTVNKVIYCYEETSGDLLNDHVKCKLFLSAPRISVIAAHVSLKFYNFRQYD